MSKDIAFIMGALFATYFIVYPILYFAYNYVITGLGYPQYIISDFWLGMVCYFIFNIITGGFRRS